MVTIRSVNEIISSLRDFFKLAQPDLDTKPGTVGRDLFIEGPASALSLLYDELSGSVNKQSMRLVTGSDLDKLALNFALTRRQSTSSTGISLFTFSSINANINIGAGNTVVANNGVSFQVATGVAVSSSATNFYRSVAAKYATQLAYVGITDQYAVEVTVIATAAGTSGNIGTFSINKTSIPGVSNVTNVVSFTGGTNQETDAAFRNRVLSTFSGSSVGTTLGYLNTALSVTGVSDATVIGPGDPLMTRDGTVVTTNADNSLTIVSEGSGGKVDVVVLGSNLVQNTDSFIYQDKSNNNDPANIKNNFVLGQIAADSGKTIKQKRIDDIKNGQTPAQPVQSLLQVTGSSSGSNFIPVSTDKYGRVTGNYELIKDTGVYGGSPFGFDTFAWRNNKVSFQEDIIKGQPYGQDGTTFTDVLVIPAIQQSLSITNENSIVTIDRSIIQLLHTPVTNVTRVFNVNTGERYVISNQNLDATSPFNNTGRIQITGNTLPAPSDVLQVDYNWIVSYDPHSDYDGLSDTFNPRPVTDSVDWGYASTITRERITFNLNVGNNFYTGNVSHPINTIISAKSFQSVDGYVQTVSSGNFINRLSVITNFLSTQSLTVDSVTAKNSNAEIYNTAQADGSFTSIAQVIGVNLLYQTEIILPTDSSAVAGQFVTITLNGVDTFFTASDQGSASGTQITIPSAIIGSTSDTVQLDITYIAAIADMFSSATTTLPTSRSGNGYLLNNNNGFNNFSIANTLKREHQVVQQNLSSQFYVEISAPVNDLTINVSNILSVVRLSDGLELWNSDNPGTINATASSGNYQLIFSTGYNSPATGDRVLVLYYATDIRRFQPFSFSNTPIKYRVDSLTSDYISGKISVPINSYVDQVSNLTYDIFDPVSGAVFFSITDGYLTNHGTFANIGSATANFSTLVDLINHKVHIKNAVNLNNNGIYDISSYDSLSNTIDITEQLNNITADQITVIRLLDGQEQWNYNGVIDNTNNKLLLPTSANLSVGDKVFTLFFNFKNLRKAPTSIIGTTADQVVNTGIMTLSGTTFYKVSNVVFTATNTGLKLNLSEAVRTSLGLNSTAILSSNLKLARVISLSKVITASTTDNTVLETTATYDVKNTTIANNLLFADEMLANPALQNFDFVLPNTSNNTLNTSVQNIPKIGDKLLVTFYYTVDNDFENLSYTRNGSLYTNKKFALINRMYVSSGFKSSQSTKFTTTSFTQPTLGARYTVFYNYLAPKQNERIVITYNYNKLVSDVTFALENSRPINADVLARAAKQVFLDLTMSVVIDPTMLSSTTTILQNLRNQILAAMTTTKLGQIVDQVTLINIAQSVSGIARARILYFNITGGIGQVLQVTAHEDQYFSPNNVFINTETR